MIPKKIHYCWLSDDPFPEKIQKCIDSWHKYLPDYEIIKWDLNRFPLEKSVWVKEAYERKKYAFAADYIRLYALATEGGIYLDSDVEVLKSFDPLLSLPYFICKEFSPKGLEAAAIGVEPGCDWIKKCLEYYKNKQFVGENGTCETKVLPQILESEISKHYKICYVNSEIEVLRNKDTVYVLPHEFFSPKNYVSKRIYITERTYSIHHYAGTWQPLWKKTMLLFYVPLKTIYTKYISNIFS